MEMKQIPEVVLNSGHKMPVIAMGTATGPLRQPDAVFSAVLDAIEAGYRHFDTAQAYGSEEPLGKAVAKALEKGLVKSRDELFITTKVWCSACDPDLILPALKESLETLGLEYVDLYLIHWPVRLRQDIAEPLKFSTLDILPFDIKGTWEAMEECSKLGLAKSIGLSNYSIKKISHLLEHATIPPAVNQVEMNVAWQQKKMLEFCKEKGINVSAWSPLGAAGAYWGSDAVVKSQILKEVESAKGKSLAQIALRWIYEQGASVIVKSFNKERMRQNLEIFDWELGQEELENIKKIPQRKGFTGAVIFVGPDGPFKTLDDLWDGEI